MSGRIRVSGHSAHPRAHTFTTAKRIIARRFINPSSADIAAWDCRLSQKIIAHSDEKPGVSGQRPSPTLSRLLPLTAMGN
jgi:hypothetical protein